MIAKLPNVELFPGSEMTAMDCSGFGADHLLLATGSHWRRDAIGTVNLTPLHLPRALTPDDIFAGAAIHSPVVIYDDEHYFMGGALAEKLRLAGHAVSLVTSHASASSWTAMTDEHPFVQARLLESGVVIVTAHLLAAHIDGGVRLTCAFTGRENQLPCETLIMVTGRTPDDRLYRELSASAPETKVTRIGDCLQPSTIADAVYSAHRFAREFGESDVSQVPLRERPAANIIA